MNSVISCYEPEKQQQQMNVAKKILALNQAFKSGHCTPYYIQYNNY